MADRRKEKSDPAATPDAKDRLPDEAGVKSFEEVGTPSDRGAAKTPKEREYQFKLQRLTLLLSYGYPLARHGFTCATVVLVAWLVSGALRELAGKETAMQAIVDLGGRFSVNSWASWLAAAIMGVGWRRTWKSKQRLTKENLPRLAQLEAAIDPKRTSSGLDESGGLAESRSG